MTALLVLVTLVSLAIAGVLAIQARQLARAERERAEANAAALADMIGPAHLEPPASIDAPVDAVWPSAMFAAQQPASRSPRMFLIPLIGLFVVVAALSTIYLWNRSTAQAATVPSGRMRRSSWSRCDTSDAAR